MATIMRFSTAKDNVSRSLRNPRKRISMLTKASTKRTEDGRLETTEVRHRDDRIAQYERAFASCMRTFSPFTHWVQRMKAKGLPKPMTEGYQPPVRPRVVIEAPASHVRQNRPEINLTASFSTFIRKSMSTARSSSAPSFSSSTFSSPRPVLTEPPKPSASRFLTASLNRLSLNKPASPKPAPEPSSSRQKHISLPLSASDVANKTGTWRERSSSRTTSILLDRLRSRRTTENLVEDPSLTVQANRLRNHGAGHQKKADPFGDKGAADVCQLEIQAPKKRVLDHKNRRVGIASTLPPHRQPIPSYHIRTQRSALA